MEVNLGPRSAVCDARAYRSTLAPDYEIIIPLAKSIEIIFETDRISRDVRINLAYFCNKKRTRCLNCPRQLQAYLKQSGLSEKLSIIL